MPKIYAQILIFIFHLSDNKIGENGLIYITESITKGIF